MGKLLILLCIVLAVILLPLLVFGFMGLLALGVLFMLLLMLGGIALFVFWIWMLISCIRNDQISANERLIWVIVIVFLNIIGAVLYYFLGRGKKKKEKKHQKKRK